jgi:hypothetical protein
LRDFSFTDYRAFIMPAVTNCAFPFLKKRNMVLRICDRDGYSGTGMFIVSNFRSESTTTNSEYQILKRQIRLSIVSCCQFILISAAPILFFEG